jgi:autotransporter-associated beta strand protein
MSVFATKGRMKGGMKNTHDIVLNAFEVPVRARQVANTTIYRPVMNAWVACFCLLALSATYLPATPTTLTWTGGSFTSAHWSDSQNWDAQVIPTDGATLIFPSNLAQQFTSTNDLVGLTLNQLQFTGNGPSIVLGGNAFNLTNGIQANYSSTIGAIYINNAISLAGTDSVINVAKSGYLVLAGTLSGSVGVTKTGQGVLVYHAPGNNSYTGTTQVNDGWLELNVGGNHAFAGPLVVGDGTGAASPLVALMQNSEMSGAAVTVKLNGTLDFNGFSDYLTTLTLQGGTVQSGAGTVSMVGDVTVLGSSRTPVISGNLRFSGGLHVVNVSRGTAFPDLNLAANVGDTGGGLLFSNTAPSPTFAVIYGSNSFTGPLTLDNLTLSVEAPSALGATNSTTTVGSHGRLWLSSTGITNHSMTLADGATLVGQYNCTWAGPITLNGSVTIDCLPVGSTLELEGPISGPGGFTKIDEGTLRLSGTNANTYGATTTVAGGTLELNKSGPMGSAIAVPGSLILSNASTARLLQSWQLYSPNRLPSLTVTLGESSLFDLAGSSEWIGPLTTQGARITTGNGVLWISGDIKVVSSQIAKSIIDGNLQLYAYPGPTNTTFFTSGHWFSPDLTISANVGSSSSMLAIIADGQGEVELAGTNNTFGSPVIINKGSLWVDYPDGLGNTNQPAIVNPGGNLFLNHNATIGLKPLILNGIGIGLGALAASGNNSWAGDITLASDSSIDVYSSANLTLGGAISGPGGLTKLDQGIVLLNGSSPNTFAGATFVQQGVLALSKTNAVAIPGPVTIGAGQDGANGDIVRTLQGDQLAHSNVVNISSSGLFDVTLGTITRVGSIAGSGSVAMGSSQLMMGYDNSSTSFGGSISGFGDLTKLGTGTFTYTGSGTYSGNFTISGGQMFVNGSLASAAMFFYTGTTLGGSGSVGPITSGYGLLTPGNNNPGLLNSGSLSLGSGDTLLVYINGTNAGSGYSQLSLAGGTIGLGNAHLQLNMSVLGAISNQFTLIHNPTTHTVNGTFAGLPEGATVTANNGVHFTISYNGGSGNEVVLTQTSVLAPPTPADLTAITLLGGGNVSLKANGAPNTTYHILANTDLGTTNWIILGPVTADNVGALIWTDSQAGAYPVRFYRIVYP